MESSLGGLVPSNIKTPAAFTQQTPKGVLATCSWSEQPTPSYSASRYQPASEEDDTFITYNFFCLKANNLFPRLCSAEKESPSFIPKSKKYESGNVANLLTGE